MTHSIRSIILLLALGIPGTLFAQQGAASSVTPSPLRFPQWGNDVQITSTEPLGQPGAVGTPTGHAYIAVPDTAIFSGREIILYQSTDLGQTWAVYPQAIPGNSVVRKCKLVRSNQDSVYLFFQKDTVLACWNIATTTYFFFTLTGVVDFDAAVTKSGTLHLVTQGTNLQVSRFSSSNGGRSWKKTGTVATSGMTPRVTASLDGDTLVATVFNPLRADRSRSQVTAFIYREPQADSLTFIRSSLVASDTSRKMDHMAVMSKGVIWFFLASGDTGFDISCRVSTNGGISYGQPFPIANVPGYDEYWMDAKPFGGSGTGVDLLYFADTLHAGTSSSKGRILFNSASTADPESFFFIPDQVSEHSPRWSPAGYAPTVVEFNDTSLETGAVWVGLDGTQKKLFYDRLNANPTAINQQGSATPLRYELAQNYPNPFNPVTRIHYTVGGTRGSGLGTRKTMIVVYDLLGRQVATLVNEDKVPGSYEVSFDGSGLASGVYLYRLTAGSFVQTRKMILIK